MRARQGGGPHVEIRREFEPRLEVELHSIVAEVVAGDAHDGSGRIRRAVTC